MTTKTVAVKKNSTAIKPSSGDRIFYAFVDVLMYAVLLVILYPLIYVVSASFSSARMVSSGQVILWPVDFSLEGYIKVFEYRDIWTGYRNTIIYTVLGTCVNIVMTVICAYPLSRRDLKGRNTIMLLFSFTMIFNAGMIPNYILMRDLKLIDTLWVMVIPGAISVYNMIIARTFFQSNIPGELLEAAQIDGCSDLKFFWTIVLPLSKAILAVLVIFYAVGHWNSYFNAFLYLNTTSRQPLQIVLRNILINAKIAAEALEDPETAQAKEGLADLLKFSLMVVSSVPVLILYPFAQKYFVQGVMIGSIKG